LQRRFAALGLTDKRNKSNNEAIMAKQRMHTCVEQWIAAWNAHILDAIVEQYVPTIRFSVPAVASRWNKAVGILIGRDELPRQFKRGPDRDQSDQVLPQASIFCDQT
jgi:hypothetical protein